jgi:hypothetical protein
MQRRIEVLKHEVSHKQKKLVETKIREIKAKKGTPQFNGWCLMVPSNFD